MSRRLKEAMDIRTSTGWMVLFKLWRPSEIQDALDEFFGVIWWRR